MPRAWPENRPYRGFRATGRRDLEIAGLAARQHGVVGLAQLCKIGLGEDAVWSRCSAGRLHRVHQGVYAVGHPLLTRKGRLMAAVLACGEAAFISHRSAADLWGIAPTERRVIDVASPTRAGRRHHMLSVHRLWEPADEDVTSVDGIPCSSVARTLLDLAGVVNQSRLERAVERTEVLRLFDLREVDELLARAGARPGTRRLRNALGPIRHDEISRSDLERRFLALARRHSLPLPASNAWVSVPGGGFEVDFLWDRERLVVETDGHRFHSTRTAFESDRRRDQLLVAAGYDVVRFTWRQVTDAPAEVATTLRALLSDRGARARSRRPSPA
jgi:hypothetical protein